jgi:hypothetical protein
LFGDLCFAGQELTSGNGAAISNSKLNALGANFINAQIAAGMVVYLQSEDGSVDGGYEVVAIDSATELTISVLRADNQTQAIMVPDSSDVSYRICTYQAQSNEMFLRLTQHFGLRPGIADGKYSVDDILDTSVLKQVSVYGILSLVYATLADDANQAKESRWKKSEYYRQLYEKALQRCRVTIDLGDDGVADSVLSGASVRLLRD